MKPDRLDEVLDQHNQRTKYERERLERLLSLRPRAREEAMWKLSMVALKLLKPVRLLYEALARWQHDQRVRARQRLNR